MGIEHSTPCTQNKSSTTEPHCSPLESLWASPKQIPEQCLWPIVIHMPVSLADSTLRRVWKCHFYTCTKDRLRILLFYYKNVSYYIFIAFTRFLQSTHFLATWWYFPGSFISFPLLHFSRDEANSNVFTVIKIMLNSLALVLDRLGVGGGEGTVLGSVFRPLSLLAGKCSESSIDSFE